ncbi:dicarboxylate/amino acid:cation symporter [Acetobacterium woodii]|uniref:Proton/sodium-glutamate symporter GltT n=1 Tax=Acetobacterium woodii (strain ATCC 29683 / DSM 1030 / JCM 2381 / KCTC 1655 / WB1) TaxID=931626 RepID=H6LKK9_ACEWD|nr:cation:dicarboxylase symporter family transporter [Acetobacterium woodii]AFA48801.1 proton/sodium-glutamate symporter GltT [Acetobacterium woodii DSM 1030]
MEQKKTLLLSLSSLDEANEFVQEMLQNYKCPKSDSIRAQLFVEETIVYWLKEAKQNETFELSIKKRFKTITLTLNYRSEPKNPLTASELSEDQELEFSRIGQDILIGLSSVTYSYEKGNNISYTLKQKPLNPALTTAIAFVSAILCGLIFLAAAPALGKMFGTMILTPISSTFFGFLNAIVIPVLFFSAIGSIFNMDNLAQMKKIFRMLLTWTITIILVTSAVSLLVAQIFLLSEASTQTQNVSGDLWQQIGTMIFGIIPTNIIQPFLDGNTLQIMFLAVVSGVVMLTLNGRFPSITKIITESNLIFSTILDAVCALMPLVVFISILNMMVSGEGIALLGAFRLIMLILGSYLIINLILLASVAIIEKISPLAYLKTAAPFLLVAMSTASSSAAFASHTATALSKQKIRDSVVYFSIPVGVLFNKQDAIPLLILTSPFVGQIYGINFTIAEMIPVVVLCMILSVAVPPSPGMGAFIFTIVYNLLGIPLEGLALAVTIAIFMDYPATASNVMITNIGMLHTEHWLKKREESTKITV